MIVLVERHGCLAQAPESVLRIAFNRENRNWFYLASRIPAADWPNWRDTEITRILESLEWFALWSAPDGIYTVRKGMGRTEAHKRGDVARLVHISARGNIIEQRLWRRGYPCPGAYTHELIAKLWDECAKEWQSHIQDSE